MARRRKSRRNSRLARPPKMTRRADRAMAVLFVITALSPLAAQTQPALQIPAAAQASPSFDVERATEAYLATVPPEKRARSDAYFEGGYWLQLWGFLYNAIILWALLA